MTERTVIFSTADRARAEDAVGKVFMIGAVPYLVTEAVPVDRREWEVRGVPQDPHGRPA